MRQEGNLAAVTINQFPTSSCTYYSPCHTAAHADVIVDLCDGPEDSEYKDLEDELDV